MARRYRRQAIGGEMANESMDDDDSRTSSGAFLTVDLECVLHKYRRWHQCFPRVKPFYGEESASPSLILRAAARGHSCEGASVSDLVWRMVVLYLLGTARNRPPRSRCRRVCVHPRPSCSGEVQPQPCSGAHTGKDLWLWV